MPNYGYRCQTCQREFEVLQRMTDPPQATCPDCGGAGTRLFYPAGILFKGSGFYKTDSRSSGSAATPPGDGASKPAEPAKPATAPATTPSATPPSTSSTPTSSTSAASATSD